MTEIKDIQINVEKLLGEVSPPVVELRKALLEIEELIYSADYLNIPPADQDSIQVYRRNLKSRLNQIEEDITTSEKDQPPILMSLSEIGDNQVEAVSNGQLVRDPQADRQMEEAERLFYGGRYSEAIKNFDKVLQIEPGWERARQHRSESENYLRTGYIPAVALPPEAASAFGKAQSAARVGRYTDALNMLSKAQAILHELGIQRWQEGLEFEQKLQENIDAELAYEEGLQLFQLGKIEELIERLDTAARATGLPKYGDKAQAFRKVNELVREINKTISSPNLDPKSVTQAKSDLDTLLGEYGENPVFLRLTTRLESLIPRALSPLQEQARQLKAQAERAVTLDEALYLGRQAKYQLDQIRNLTGLDEGLDHLSSEIEKFLRDLTRLQDELSQANAAYENHKRWPSQAAHISKEARQRYPNDPNVIRLNRLLSPYSYELLLLKIVLGVFGVVIIGIFLFFGFGRFRSYLSQLTPTTTSTPTTTPTQTPTITTTSTPSRTPTPTPTFTPTLTPFIGVALRDVWARSGCYEGYNAIGRIPTGGGLRFLPDERRFDTFNRECVLVEHQGEERSIIGWILIADVGSPPGTPQP